jgi:endonuclease G
MMNSRLTAPGIFIGLFFIASCTKQTVNKADEPTNTAKPDTIIVTPFPTYNDTITAGDDNNMLLGNPTLAEPNVLFTENYLINQVYYIESYSRNRGIPNWVSWHLEAKDAVKGTDRQDDFRPFTGLPTGWYRVGANSYNFDVNKFDRGHNCPSADRISALPANSSTFYMTNMIPQAPNLNQGPWEGLEDFIRNTLVGPSNEAFIIMGSYGQGGLGTGKTDTAKTIDNGRVTVPKMVWKVAVVLPKNNNDLNRIDANTTILAVNMPNVGDKFSVSNKNAWRDYLTTVNDLEANARLHSVDLNLLSNINATVRAALKARKYN